MNQQGDTHELTFKNLLNVLNESSIVAFTDLDGLTTYANDKFCEISKYSREELIGQNHRILKSGYHSKEFYRNLWSTIKSGKVWTGEIKNLAKDGEYYWVNTTIIPCLDSSGVLYQFAAIRIDITEKKFNEEVQRKSVLENNNIKIQKRAYEKFVSTLVHDIRNPLMFASVSAQLIQRMPNTSEKVAFTAEKIVTRLKRVDEMLTSALETSSQQNDANFSLTINHCDAVEIIRSVLDDLVIIHGHRFILDSIEHYRGAWSASCIQRIVENLCTNAVKYGDAVRAITVGLKEDEQNLNISVHNCGNPIPAEDMKSIFEYMHRTESAESGHEKGWGIGLSVVSSLARAHGGTSNVESSLREGTTFTVSLPFDHHL